MLSVTTTAKEKLREELLKVREEDNESLIRIAPSSSSPAKIGFVLDREKEGDNVIKDNEGQKLLLINTDLARDLKGMILDFQETDEGLRYTIISH
jgi:Fe-S cluster assembly iron-binding protein IscA